MSKDNKKPKWKKVLLALTIVLALLWIPPTRYMIFWLLPIGSGIDDLIFIIVAIVIFIIAFVRGWIQIPKFFKTIGDD